MFLELKVKGTDTRTRLLCDLVLRNRESGSIFTELRANVNMCLERVDCLVLVVKLTIDYRGFA